jgi:hypothetical protein
MIFLGVALLVLGFFASIPILWPVGIILLVIGIVIEPKGMAGHDGAWAAALLLSRRRCG